MSMQSAYQEVELEFGGVAVFLRPSLRAAMRLECLHDGFPKLMQKIAEFDTQTVKAVLEAAAGRSETQNLLNVASGHPLSQFAVISQASLFKLVDALMPGSTGKQASEDANPMPWSEVYRELFKAATGVLGWPPETAWNATPQEIVDAFEAHMEMLTAIHGGPAEETGVSEEQRQQNLALGLDPEFDREGLSRLRAIAG